MMLRPQSAVTKPKTAVTRQSRKVGEMVFEEVALADASHAGYALLEPKWGDELVAALNRIKRMSTMEVSPVGIQRAKCKTLRCGLNRVRAAASALVPVQTTGNVVLHLDFSAHIAIPLMSNGQYMGRVEFPITQEVANTLLHTAPCRVLEYVPEDPRTMHEASQDLANLANGSQEPEEPTADAILAQLRARYPTRPVTSESPKRLGWNEPLHEAPAPAPVNTYVLTKMPRDCTALVSAPGGHEKTLKAPRDFPTREDPFALQSDFVAFEMFPNADLFLSALGDDLTPFPLEMNSPRSGFGYPLPIHDQDKS